MVIEAERPSDLPHSIFVLPESDEFCFSNIRWIAGMMKAMNANLHGTIVRYGIDLQGTGNQFARYFAANVFLEAIQKRLSASTESCDVVIELQILRHHGGNRRQIAVVVRVKQFRIKRLHSIEQRLRRGLGLRTWSRQERTEQHPDQQHGKQKNPFHFALLYGINPPSSPLTPGRVELFRSSTVFLT